jgi:CHAT domain
VHRISQLAGLDVHSGRATEALERLRLLRSSPAMVASAGWRDRVDLELQFSRAFHAAGMPDSAIAAIRRAGDAWERIASGVRSAEWYEPFGNSAGQLATQTARVLLDPRRRVPDATRVREAFDAVQRYKSRALEWRASGTAAAGAGLATVAAMQRLLRPGEVLLDAYSSQYDSTVVFALDRASVRVHWVTVAGDEDLGVHRATALLRSGDASAAPRHTAAGRRLAADVLGPALELVKPARRVLCSLSGMLNAIPIAALPADSASDVPMIEGRTVAAIPSASWLARARRAGPAAVGAAVVVTVARTTDDRGRALAGVRDEARWMTGRYGDAGIVHAGDRPLAAVVPWISRGDILHVSSHARTSARDPWGSAFLLGRGEDEDAWLSAREIASHRPSAKLAVLASCRTTLDRGFSNESVLGLSRAFLAAGVPAVLSTLWPVDDEATADFTRRFYLGLEEG